MWQPFKTAPRDGTKFVARNLAYGFKDKGRDIAGPVIMRWKEDAYQDEGDWVIDGGWMRSEATISEFALEEPTEWAALP
jgi:hypothetical protein